MSGSWWSRVSFWHLWGVSVELGTAEYRYAHRVGGISGGRFFSPDPSGFSGTTSSPRCSCIQQNPVPSPSGDSYLSISPCNGGFSPVSTGPVGPSTPSAAHHLVSTRTVSRQLWDPAL